MRELSTDITMETVYSRSKTNAPRKAKTVFKGVLGKLLLSSLALSVATGAIPMSMITVNAYEPINTAEIQVDESLATLRNTIEALENLKAEGYISEASLKNLANTIDSLNASNVNAYEVSTLLDRVEKIIEGVDKNNVDLVKSAIARARDRFGLNVEFVDSYEVKQAKAGNISFPDVKQGDWYYDNVMSLVGMGAINGYDDGTFKPSNNISYAEYLTILVKTTHAGSGDYSVSSDEAWYNGIVRAAYESDIIKSSDIKDFGAPITRADAAKFTEKAVQKVLGEAEVDTTNMDKLINDYNSFKGSSAEYYILQQYGKGIVVGDDKNNFNANSNLTRAEASTIILRTVRPENRRDMSNVNIDEKPEVPPIITEDGYVYRTYAEEYILNAMKTVRFYRENDKYFVSVNLPELPNGVKYRYTVKAFNSEGDCHYLKTFENEGIEPGLHVVEVTKNSEIKGDFYNATIEISAITNTNRIANVSYELATLRPNEICENSVNGYQWSSYDTSSIFNW